MLTSKEIRESFKKFFEEKGHKVVPSAPMVIKDDPTLMFTNAGMNQFKDIILGNRPAEAKRVTDSQKCLRVSGKHNDLEEVGHDTYHHTMFEMLGNWSFGDYFKKEAIDWAWEYLTEVVKLDPNRLYATVFEGYAPEGLERDNEAAGIWEKHLPASHIINGNRHDNFWEMGETGPCGPCSEIHIDLRSDEERKLTDGATLVNKDNPLVIEIWNLVFMQYNRKADGHLEPLPAKVIDTGMGFERLCMALQGKKSNYDTDVFTPLIYKISELSGKKYGTDTKVDIAMRVAADHVRTIAFSIADSQLPSNAKAGYVIRRILRRAVRYVYTFLDQKEAFLYKLVDTLVEQMGDAYPELPAQKELIKKVIKEEEDSFLRTLDNGIRLLDSFIKKSKDAGKENLAGEDAFVLYDTYGFPLDLTELILREQNMGLERDGFDKEMKKQKDRARNAAAVEATDWVEVSQGEEEFVGYDLTETPARILRYRKVKQKGKEYYQIMLSKTPFYAEMGGQVGDKGVLVSPSGEIVNIFDTKKENNVGVHLSYEIPSDPTEVMTARIDKVARAATSANHSATHLLHEALREVLGTHVEQKGSFVSPEVLRFDFSHFQKVTPEELRQVEHLVNSRIRMAMNLEECRELPIAEAREMGAMALFGEKYGDKVRVVKYGSSVELCGGTHVANTGNIGMLRILSESSIAAGIRRIEAVTGTGVENMMDNLQDMMKDVAGLLGGSADIKTAVTRAIGENADLRHQVEEFMAERIATMSREAIASAKDINGIKLVSLSGIRLPDIVKNVAFTVRRECTDHTAFVGVTVSEGKPLLTVALSDDLVKAGLNAGQIVREAAKLIKGGGGGQPFFAQAGGKDAEGVSLALEKIMELLHLK
ncbi:alanine--tRNA ligase [Muribaculaceae bacterium Isolate-113 (HZI)]|nr:alanine--tRNA ligase [Muribaculaceae bacterium]ROT19369.1 alanine--tRNA ligase [Muribaculaceae bacterium Isolate-114 (HZI)]ROT21033.1 alanine--tRNA ligase [Muribaculaceae bacterium Isolate-113 (HZI)]GFI56620.1 alanine--tRNA ligase [Muribaculaceae bacterium]